MSAQAINVNTNGMHQQQQHGNPQLQQQPPLNIYPNNIKSSPEQPTSPQQQQPPTAAPQPSVRHIPIFVEGRDEPLINKNIETSTKNASSQYQQQQQPSSQQQQHHHHQQNDLPGSKSSGGIFDRVKNFPTISRMQSTYANRSNSPNRSVPVNVQRSTSATRNNYQHSSGTNSDNNSRWSDQPQHNQQQYNHNQYSQQNHQPYQQKQQMTTTAAPPPAASGYGYPQQKQQQHQQPRSSPDTDSITKIQNIQCDVLDLMDEVEKFNGCSRKDRQYLYLDEMLTQNLLKLDTIDADGKDNIKQARREAIKCINTCIAVLEAKADSATVQQMDKLSLGNNSVQQQQQPQQQQNYNQNRQ